MKLEGHLSLVRSSLLSSCRYLEGVHIAILAHILRRPIICYSEDSNDSQQVGQSISGVYLPILHHPKDCCRIPLAIIYTMVGILRSDTGTGLDDSHIGHFSAIVGVDYRRNQYHFNQFVNEESREELQIGYYPLVTRNYQLMPLRYCFPLEESEVRGSISPNHLRDDPRTCQELLLRYLDVSRIRIRSSNPEPLQHRELLIVSQSAFTPEQNETSWKRRNASSTKSVGDNNQPYPSSLGCQSRRQFLKSVCDSKKDQYETLRLKLKTLQVLFID